MKLMVKTSILGERCALSSCFDCLWGISSCFCLAEPVFLDGLDLLEILVYELCQL